MLKGEKLGEIAELARLEVEFRHDFSNVLCMVTKLVLLQNDTRTTTAKIEYDLEFLVSLPLLYIVLIQDETLFDCGNFRDVKM